MDKTALYKLSYGLYVIGVQNGDGFGGCVVDSLAQISSAAVPHVIVSVMNANNTRALIEHNGCFTVSVLPCDTDPFTVANFGFQSSRDCDKWQNVEHELFHSLPVLSLTSSVLYLRVTNTMPFETHTAFICEVEDAVTTGGDPLIYGDYLKNMKGDAAKAFALFKDGKRPLPSAPKKNIEEETTMENKDGQWVCTVCGYVYDGDEPFEELPEDWVCPLCSQPKDVFELQ